MLRSALPAICSLTLLGAGACIDDPAALSDEPLSLSAAEAEILGITVWRDIMTQQAVALANADNVESLIDFVLQTQDRRVEVDLVADAECEFGGDRVVTGNVRGEADTAGAGFVQVEIIQSWDECAIADGDARVQLTGDPDINARVRYDFTADRELDLEGRMEGSLKVLLPDGRSGDCPYSVTFSGAESLTTGRFVFRAKGLACGEDINARTEL
jgi:hypothetical protein